MGLLYLHFKLALHHFSSYINSSRSRVRGHLTLYLAYIEVPGEEEVEQDEAESEQTSNEVKLC